MGGSYETKVTELRMHVSGREVHVHDDKRGLKFTAAQNIFKRRVEEALEDLKGTEGIVKVAGKTDTDLYLLKEGSTLQMFILPGGKDTSRSLKSFINKI